MIDPLGAAASIITVLQLANTVINVCYDYHSATQGLGPWEKVSREVRGLRDLLETLSTLATEGEQDTAMTSRLITLKLLCDPSDGPLAMALAELQALKKSLTPLGGGQKATKRQALTTALLWPLKQAETQKSLAVLERSKTMLTLALAADHTKLMLAMQTSVDESQVDLSKLTQSFTSMNIDIERERIFRWLAIQDPSSNFFEARERHQAMTGSWFIRSKQFQEWTNNADSFLWLHGISGCGKTVLTSTLINHIMCHCLSKSNVGLAYFFFDFHDVEKQSNENMIRSLIAQFSSLGEKTPLALQSLFASCGNGLRQPSKYSLLVTLELLVKDFDDAFIVLDALDECVDREALLLNIEKIVQWKGGNVHTLVTSRREVDIEEALEPLATEQGIVSIQSQTISEDIQAYVHQRLMNDRKLKRWQSNEEVKKEIETTLVAKADGMFRWVGCQLDALSDSLTLPMLRKSLRNLPKTLDDTYARILCAIDEEHSKYVLSMLQWLVSSARPLRLEELAEIIAIDVESSPRFDIERRLLKERDALKICSSLVATMDVANDRFSGGKTHTVLRLAHFSVKEYLLSNRIRTGPASGYSISHIGSNTHIAEACISYLLHFDDPSIFVSHDVNDFPISRYAARYWTQHVRLTDGNAKSVHQLTMELLASRDGAYETLNWLYDPDYQRREASARENYQTAPPPSYYASQAGLLEAMRRLLQAGAEVNAIGGRCGNPLQVAAASGNVDIARLLISKGADVNCQGGHFGNALQAAAANGFEVLVKTLLAAAANVEAKGGEYSFALQAAAFEGHDEIVKCLIAHGANVNAERGRYGNALLAAASEGHASIVEQLLVQGADPNAEGGFFGRALHEAAGRGHNRVVKLLVGHGAAINFLGGDRYPLQAAAFEGQHEILEFLLCSGADVNAEGGYYHTALQAGSSGGSARVIEQLLAHGANVNLEGGTFGNALQAACYKGHEKCANLLLLGGADATMRGRYGNAMQVAIFRRHDGIVEKLKAAALETY